MEADTRWASFKTAPKRKEEILRRICGAAQGGAPPTGRELPPDPESVDAQTTEKTGDKPLEIIECPPATEEKGMEKVEPPAETKAEVKKSEKALETGVEDKEHPGDAPKDVVLEEKGEALPTNVMGEGGVIPKKTPAATDLDRKAAEKPSGAGPKVAVSTKATEPKKAPTVSAKELGNAPPSA